MHLFDILVFYTVYICCSSLVYWNMFRWMFLCLSINSTIYLSCDLIFYFFLIFFFWGGRWLIWDLKTINIQCNNVNITNYIYYNVTLDRSVNDTLLTPNRNRTVKYGRRLMDTAVASLWNTLPIDIKNALNIVSF